MAAAVLMRIAAVAVALLGSGCSTTTSAPPLLARPAADRDANFDLVLRLFAERYIDPAALDPTAMLDGAVAELERQVSDLSSRTNDAEIELQIAGRRASVGRSMRDLGHLARELDAVSDWVVRTAPSEEPLAIRAAALRGAVRAVDRWANVLHGRDKEALMNRFRGSMAGVGCRIGRRDGSVRILEVYPGSPGDRAGLRGGDRVLAIDGRPIDQDTVAQAVELLRGDVDTRTIVRVARGPRNTPVEIAVTRARFVVPTASSRMIGGTVGYLRISQIAKNSGVVTERILAGLRGSPSLKGIVLDLRGNTGGSLLATGSIADLFVDTGVLIETRGRDGRAVSGLQHRIEASASATPRLPEPVVVLVDARTGSSAEFLAAALVGRDRAILVGQRTFGKGVLQKTYDIGDRKELLLKLTVARAFAAGQAIPETGLVPDVALRSDLTGAREVSCGGSPPDSVATEPVAAVTLPEDGGSNTDADLAFAVELIERFAAPSRAEALAKIHRGLCMQASGGDSPFIARRHVTNSLAPQSNSARRGLRGPGGSAAPRTS